MSAEVRTFNHLQQFHAFLVLCIFQRLTVLKARIWNTDMSMVKAKLMSRKHEGWSEVEADRHIEEYRRFIYMAVFAKFAVIPTREIDAVWHHHILHTREYDRFCQYACGHFIHHQPSAEDTQEQDRIRMHRIRVLTAELYERIFSQTYGKTHAYCGKCGCTPNSACNSNCGVRPHTAERGDCSSDMCFAQCDDAQPATQARP